MTANFIANASIVINAPRHAVWQALVSPQAIKQYMFGAHVVSDWQEGSPIIWKGQWQGKTYEDKGTIRQCTPEYRLQYSHFSPLSGLPDRPDNYHMVTIDLAGDGEQTCVTLSQDNNPTEDARTHSEHNWRKMLEGLKKVVET